MTNPKLRLAPPAQERDADLIELCDNYFRLVKAQHQACDRGASDRESNVLGDKVADLIEKIVQTKAESASGVTAKVLVLADWDGWDDAARIQSTGLEDRLQLSLAADLDVRSAQRRGTIRNAQGAVGDLVVMRQGDRT